ncbi:SDR family oxidoreductase [Synechococcus elongatus]|uniref:SDR family oxidoreductase n=1 Tax=Synechococcus elongatus PCC 11801 TaxID=2219813 RepID=A0AAN1UTM6_SYNEL|nr:SDR family oxidoreductase [Synechococcus elongatus]AZB71692.1 SDR family NAD(P)-dependent oxidoreductase [Synechococcus elongatus PCC 11801]
MKVLILGGGYTGQHLAQLLTEQAISVLATTRSGQWPLNLPCLTFDASTTPPLLPNPDILAGVTHVLSTIPPLSDGRDPVLATLLPTLQQLPLQWCGYLSTTGVYGDTQGAWVDEESPLQSTNRRSQQRIAIEAQWQASGLPAHIFRLPGIYGPGRSSFDRLRRGDNQRLLKPGHVFCRIHVDDIAAALWASMQHPNPGRVYNVSDDCPCEPALLIEEAARLMDLELPPAQPFDAVELSPMAASFWSECRRVRNDRLKQELGVQLRYPSYREGLAAIWTAEQS